MIEEKEILTGTNVSVKGKNPPDIQQKGIAPISTVVRATTGMVTTYMVDAVVVWVWLTILLRILYIFTTVTRSPAITGQSQIVSLVSA